MTAFAISFTAAAADIDELGVARTWVGDARHGAKFNRHVEFANAAGKTYVRAVTTWEIVAAATGRAVRVPAILSPQRPSISGGNRPGMGPIAGSALDWENELCAYGVLGGGCRVYSA